MKKIISLAVLGLLLLNAPIALADTSVQSPATFILKVSEKATVTNYQNMQIKLQKIGFLEQESYPTGIRKNAEVNVTSEGGCGNVPARDCISTLFKSTYTISEKGNVTAAGLKITVDSISSNSATFSIVIPPPVACTQEAKICSDGSAVGRTGPNCEFAACPGRRGVGSVGSGSVSPSGTFIICPNGMMGDNCSTCSDGGCSTPGTPPANQQGRMEGAATLNLPQGHELISAEKIEGSGDDSAYYKVKTKKKARLLFIFPVYPQITYSVDSTTGANIMVGRSWWNFLAW